MEQKKKADGATWVLRVGLAVGVVAIIQAANEATRQAGQDYSSVARTAALALVFVVGAFAVRAWQSMGRDDADE